RAHRDRRQRCGWRDRGNAQRHLRGTREPAASSRPREDARASARTERRCGCGAPPSCRGSGARRRQMAARARHSDRFCSGAAVRAPRLATLRRNPQLRALAGWTALSDDLLLQGAAASALEKATSLHPTVPTVHRRPGCGRVAERLNAPVLKTGKSASSSWVRIPPLPPDKRKALAEGLFLFGHGWGYRTHEAWVRHIGRTADVRNRTLVELSP